MPTQMFAIALIVSIPATASLHGQNRVPNRAQQRSTPPPSAALPAIAATANAPAQPVEPVVPPTPAQSPAKRATVTYTGGQLTVSASNSSLNQILREISHSTGIKITGGVQEERVFGDYGPASPSDVLSSLLDGTASNMILVDGSGDRATELILTPRTGGPTPPNPNSASFDSSDDDSSRPAVVAPSVSPQSQPAASPVAGPLPPQNPDMPATSPNPPSSDSNGQSNGGPKTPQQIFDELMKMRQQHQQPQ
ncbi:MAG: hypothetical protein JSS95_16430 [Acidobacteria bacterium]|nr:hypothetical protein [Acidobacteriota bacterium]